MQTRTKSLIEALSNVVAGYAVAVVSQLVIFPMFAIHVPLSANMAIGAYFTAISLARSYTIRRIFNQRNQ